MLEPRPTRTARGGMLFAGAATGVRQDMIDPAHISGKRVALIAWHSAIDRREDVAVFIGIAHWDGETLRVRRNPPSPPLVVQTDWLARIKVVPPDLKEILLGADYCFSVTVGGMSDGEELSEYRETGLNWPDDGEGS